MDAGGADYRGSTPVRLLIVDVSPEVVTALVDLVSEFENVQVVAACDDERKTVALAREHMPDVVLIDSTMLGDGLEVGSLLAESCPRALVVATALGCTAVFVAQLQAAGVHACVEKSKIARELPHLLAGR